MSARSPSTRCSPQLDLIDWLNALPAPELTLPALPADVSRRNSFYSRHIGVLKLALDGRDRAEVADGMSRFLGDDTVTENYLNAAVSEARPSHVLNSVRYGALVHTTRDPRLVAVYADLIGHVVVPSTLVPFIRVGIALQEQEEAKRRLKTAQRLVGGAR